MDGPPELIFQGHVVSSYLEQAEVGHKHPFKTFQHHLSTWDANSLPESHQWGGNVEGNTYIFQYGMEGSHQSVTYFSKRRCDRARHRFSQDFSQNQESMSPCLYASFEGSFRNWELRLFSTKRLRDRSFAWGKTYCPSLANCYEVTAGCPTTQLRLTWFKRGHKTSRGIWESRDTVRTLPKLRIWPCLNEDSNRCCDFAIILFTHL